ncbi:MAG: hypothetical protein BGO31_07185 [Bacteroidetes bacterium 43-16]|nr:MAG: hypothetical protein BGO31_07185 [Bacteroidetes bacterium 43-16]
MKSTSSMRNFGDLMETLFDGRVSPMFREEHLNHKMQPPVNISESEKTFNIEVLAAGINKEDIKLQVVDSMLTISYEKNEPAQETKAKVLRHEFAVRSFKRSFTLGESVDAEKINASYENGILTVTLPKKEAVKPTQIEITVK